MLRQIKELEKEVAQLRKQLYKYKYDELTGLRGRHDFNNDFRLRFVVGDPFYLVLADVNGLKKANTEGGYEAGDNLILKCVNKLKQCNPTGDDSLIYRYSGDEFCILIPFNRKFHSEDLHCPSDICTLATKFSENYNSPEDMFKGANILLLDRKEEFYKLHPNDRRTR